MGARPSAQSLKVLADKAKEAQKRALFLALCSQRGLPAPTPEFRFHETRKWRFDFAFPESRVAVEVEGGLWSKGAHVRGRHALSDMQKYNEAALSGWRVLRVTPDQLLTADTVTMLHRALHIR